MVGQWSDWWTIRFSYGLGSVPGMVRLRLAAGSPRPELYVSPIQADPTRAGAAIKFSTRIRA